jgi:hypothetical protein
VILALYPSQCLGAHDIHVGAKFKKVPDYMPRSNHEFAVGLSLGILKLHKSHENNAKPLAPRIEDATMFDRFRHWLWGRLPPDMGASNLRELPLPSRVLDLGEVGQMTMESVEASNGGIRLLKKKGQTGHYATLSYCWGPIRPFIMWKKSFRERCTRIAISELPKTFQQAIVVALELGIHYLWIDALCIIQDDVDDWNQEGARMADVYRNCLVRIAATATKNSMEGFHPPEDITVSIPMQHIRDREFNHKSDHSWSSCMPWGCFTRSRPRPATASSLYYITLPKYYAYDVDHGHLNHVPGFCKKEFSRQDPFISPKTISTLRTKAMRIA